MKPTPGAWALIAACVLLAAAGCDRKSPTPGPKPSTQAEAPASAGAR